MALPIFKERRLTPRKELSGLLPGSLLLENGVNISCRPVNLSNSGLGIITDMILTEETIITLKSKDYAIKLKIQWGKPDFGKRDLYRYGLVVMDQNIDLERIFEEGNCLK